MSLPTDASSWLVSCSPERTLLARRERGESGTKLIKLFEHGSLSSAQREMAFAKLVEGKGFSSYQKGCRDARSGKPSLIMEFYHGSDLLNWVTEHGPLNIADSVAIAAQLAERLVALESVRARLAPSGIVHRDIKPGNIFLRGDPAALSHCEVIVLDLEHAIAIQPDARAPADSRFSGGSHGYSPPEAYRGAAPDPSFDVFGLGCTLQFMLTGNPAFRAATVAELATAVQEGHRNGNRALIGIPTPLSELIHACLARDAGDRPRAEAIGRRLKRFLAEHSDKDLDRIFAAIQAGDLSSTREGLAEIPPAVRGPRWQELDQLRLEAETLLADHPLTPTAEEDRKGHALAKFLTRRAPEVAAFLEHFPAHHSALILRQELLRSTTVLLLEVPRLVADHKQQAEFEAAQDLVGSTLAALAAIDGLGRLPIAGVVDERPPLNLQDPQRFLSSTRRDLDLATEQHRKLYSALLEAEADLDMGAAGEALTRFARVYGGASRVVADLKDRVHKLDFYLARTAKLAPSLSPLREQLELSESELDLGELDSFLTACARHLPEEIGGQPEPESESLLRLQRCLGDLVAEFPHIAERAEPARAALAAALANITEKAWDLLEAGRKKLAMPPIPIRPLQNLLNRLDHFRITQMLIDLPGRERANLLDQLEDLRMQVDHSRNARDRITRGVQASMEEGHLTTALYEISRAVDRFDDHDPASAPDGSPLARQFAEAKRRKEEIEEAQRKNHQLASHYVRSSESGQASEFELMALLQDRERTLQFLCTSLGKERAEMYAEDLQAVRVDLMRADARKGESLVAASKRPRQRLVIAEQTLDALRRRAPEAGARPELYAEATALVHAWERINQSAAGELSDEAAERRRQNLRERAQHKRWLVRSVAGGMAVLASMLILLTIWSENSNAGAGEKLSLDTLQRSLQELKTERELPASMPRRAEELLQLIRDLNEGDAESWLPRFTSALISYDRDLADLPNPMQERWREWARQAHRTGIDAAGAGIGKQGMEKHLAKTRALSIGLDESR